MRKRVSTLYAVGQISLERGSCFKKGHEFLGRMTVGQCQILLSSCNACPTPVASKLTPPTAPKTRAVAVKV